MLEVLALAELGEMRSWMETTCLPVVTIDWPVTGVLGGDEDVVEEGEDVEDIDGASTKSLALSEKIYSKVEIKIDFG